MSQLAGETCSILPQMSAAKTLFGPQTPPLLPACVSDEFSGKVFVKQDEDFESAYV